MRRGPPKNISSSVTSIYQYLRRRKFSPPTLIGGFSCANTRLAFDSQISLPKSKTDNYKLIYHVKINNIKQKKRVATKILKMDENNQYGNAMTKPLPCGYIKKMKKIPTFYVFHKILSNLYHEDKMGHLFIVDINFHDTNPKTMPFNEICTPIYEKNKIVQAYERSVLQLMSVLNRNEDKDIINNFKCNAKAHSTMTATGFEPTTT